MVVMDGRDVFREKVKLPVAISNMSDQRDQYFIAGGVISTHTKRRHLSLVNADKVKLEWKLGSLHVLNGQGRQSATYFSCLE